MSPDEKALAEMDCFHCYYRFRQADSPESPDQSRYEAWLDYREAIMRRDGQQCTLCGRVHPASHLDVRPRRPRTGPERLAPDNLVCVCVFCDSSTGVLQRTKRQSHLA